MGCSSSQEKLENEIMELNIEKIEIQMEKYNQMKLLGQNKTTNQIKQLQGNIINNNNINMKRKTIRAKTTKGSVEIKPGKGRRGKSVKTARVKSNINNI